jgi:hypothetical protein
MRRFPAPEEDQTASEAMPLAPWQATAAHLRGPMTVIVGRSQLLQQRIRNGQVWDAAACLETLVAIDEAVREMETQLREAETERS